VSKKSDTSPGHASFSEQALQLGALCTETTGELLIALMGQEYVVSSEAVTLRGQKAPEMHAALIRSYLSSRQSGIVTTPWRGIGDFAGAAAGSFRERVEAPIALHASELVERASRVLPLCDGSISATMIGSDLAFTVRAFPCVHLHIECSREDQEFPAEAWVLFSNNANMFLSAQELHQLGELFKDRLLGLLRIY